MSQNRETNTFAFTIQQPDDSITDRTDVERGEEDVGDVELTDLNSIPDPRTRLNEYVLDQGMIKLEPKDRNRRNMK